MNLAKSSRLETAGAGLLPRRSGAFTTRVFTLSGIQLPTLPACVSQYAARFVERHPTQTCLRKMAKAMADWLGILVCSAL